MITCQHVYILTSRRGDVVGVYTTQIAAYREACTQEGYPLEYSGNDTYAECGEKHMTGIAIEYYIERHVLKGDT